MIIYCPVSMRQGKLVDETDLNVPELSLSSTVNNYEDSGFN